MIKIFKDKLTKEQFKTYPRVAWFGSLNKLGKKDRHYIYSPD